MTNESDEVDEEERPRFVPTLEHWLNLQEQIISRKQALGVGVTKEMIRGHLVAGRWRAVYPGTRHGVYVVGMGSAELTPLQLIWAALVAIGGLVVASHETAMWVWKRKGAPSKLVHVAVLDSRKVCAPPPGVRVHTLPVLDDTTVTSKLGLRLVKYDKSVVDAAHAATTVRAALTIVYTAIQNRSALPEHLAAAMAERKRHRYRAAIGSVLIDAKDGAMSGLEHEFGLCMDRHGLPVGRRQRKLAGPAGGRYVDSIVEEGLTEPLVRELDGRTGHDLPDEVWRDMDRDNLDEEEGRGHLRYGPAQVFGEGCRVAAQNRRSLLRRGWVDTAVTCGPACTIFDEPKRNTGR